MTIVSLARTLGGACALALAAISVALPARAQSGSTTHAVTLRIVHGIPGRDLGNFRLDPLLPVDVLVDGKICLAAGLTFGSVSGPYTVPPGTYKVAVSLANTLSPCSNGPVIVSNVTLVSGANEALVAALQPGGAPGMDAVPLDLSGLKPGNARFIVAHTADAPAVDIAANGSVAIADLKPRQTREATVPSGNSYSLTVSPAGTKTVVIGPLSVTPPSRGVLVVFAVGRVASGSITAITTQIPEVF